MERSVGFMIVFAVSGSVVLVALQVHKRLLSDFMKKVELELGVIEKYQRKKKVRFAADVVEPSSDNKEYRKRRSRLLPPDCRKSDTEFGCNMQENRRAFHKDIVDFRRANTISSCV